MKNTIQRKHQIKIHLVLMQMVLLWALLFCNLFITQAMGQSLEKESFTYKGEQYLLIDGAAYLIDKSTGNKRLIMQLYESYYIAKNYTQIEGKWHRINIETGKSHPIIDDFYDGFENATSVHDLIDEKRGWTSMTLQSSRAPKIKDYVALRNKILRNQSDFLDNRIEPSTLRAHNGEQSLRFISTKAKANLPLTKASLDSELMFFGKGDSFWFSGWFFIEQGRPISLLDIEAGYIEQSPGMRLMLSDNLVPRLELKFADKPTYRLNMGKEASFPTGKWFKIKLHYTFSNEDNGVAKLWLNDELVISATGQTLPFADSILTRLQLGITANPAAHKSVVFVDDIRISKNKLN